MTALIFGVLAAITTAGMYVTWRLIGTGETT